MSAVAPDSELVSRKFYQETKVNLGAGSEHVRSALLATTRPQFRREFSDVTLVLEDGQVQSYRGLLALLSPWLGELLLAAGGDCHMVILPGTDIQLLIQQLGGAKVGFGGEALVAAKDEAWEILEKGIVTKNINVNATPIKFSECAMENIIEVEDAPLMEYGEKTEDAERGFSNKTRFSVLKENLPDLPESAAFSVDEFQVLRLFFKSPLSTSCSYN